MNTIRRKPSTTPQPVCGRAEVLFVSKRGRIMAKFTASTGTYRVESTRGVSRSNPALEPTRGDVLRDRDCDRPAVTQEEFAKAQAYRRARIARLLS
jgi:hypothetical protein